MIYRIVHEQDGREDLSTVVLAEDEVADHLMAEATLHAAYGWKVTAFTKGEVACDEDVDQVVMVNERGVVRRVWARGFDPATDGEEQS